MKKDIIEKIKIPDEIEFNVENNEVSFRYEKIENKRKFNYYGIKIKKDERDIIIESKKATKKELKIIKTIIAHINNMVKGLKEPFIYKMEIAFLHFPISIDYNQLEKKIVIKNFLGEKKPRSVNIPDRVDVKIDKNFVIISSHDKETAGQAAANIEKATHVKNRDRRKFQDGIFIIKKPKEKIILSQKIEEKIGK
ncbi:MAG: 50S ribosomal protein L6 [Candidatus Pacearchaeota archaeon]